MRTIWPVLVGVSLALSVAAVSAQIPAPAQKEVKLSIERQTLRNALNEWAQQTGFQLVSEIHADVVAPTVKGTLTPQAALERLLAETSLTYEWLSDRVVAVRDKTQSISPVAWQSFDDETQQRGVRVAKLDGDEDATRGGGAATSGLPGSSGSALPHSNSQPSEDPNEHSALEEIIVTGTNIKGVAPAGSPVLVLDEQTIRRTGYTNTEQLIQALPQNIRSGAEGATADAQLSSGSLAGLNSTFGSGVNLRGLGSGATLVLINGRRIAASSSGTYTDISLIPINAIQRVEILTDGASAIYGADAVAGVINVILKRDLDGAESRARYGSTSPSGREEMRASQSFGGRWRTGGGLVVLDYLDQTELAVTERDFTSNVPGPTSIYPKNQQLGVILSGTHGFGERWSAQMDAQYAHVKRFASWNVDGTTVVETPVEIDRTSGALSLTYSPSTSWDISLDGLVSQEAIDLSQLYFMAGSSTPNGGLSSVQDQAQKQWSTGLKATGTLFDLPAGGVGVALGVDHRSEDYLRRARSLSGSQSREPAEREVDSAFAEIHVPIFGKRNGRPGFRRLELSVAGRYDDYSDFGDTSNPKIGISWMPFSSLELRSSYSTSFRAPPTGRILSDSFTGTRPVVLIRPIATADGTGVLPAAVLTGSRDLLPEESENWTAGFTYRPEAVAGLQIGLTYYDISYTNRIITAPFDRGALSNPALQSFLTSYNTSAELRAAVQALTQAAPIYLNLTGGVFGPNPQNLATYTYDSRKTNAGVVNTNGVDLTVDYTVGWMEGTLNLALNANHISKIDTKLAPGAPSIDIVDTTGNPVGWRLRTMGAYARGGWDAALAINYTDKYVDTTGVIDTGVDAYTTVDGNLRYTFQNASSTALENFSVALSVTNLFNESPPFVQTSALGSHYDSTNADPLGRLIAVEIAKRW